MTPPDGEDNLLGLIEDVQLPVDVPTLYRGPSIDLRFACKSEQKRADERTRTADLPLITSDNQGIAAVCTGLQISAYLSRFFFSGLHSVAPYCVPGGIRVVSGLRGPRVAGNFSIRFAPAIP